MRKILQYLLKKPLTWIANKWVASPKQEMVFGSLSALYQQGQIGKDNTVQTIQVDASSAKFIIFSDQHKGNKSWADDFQLSEHNYCAALKHYNQEGYHFINLGDSEELWKFNVAELLPANEKSLLLEAAFHPQRYTKTFGNHDITWKDKFAVNYYLKQYFPPAPAVFEGVLLQVNGLSLPLNIFCTHGHQGDLMSDNNAVSTWIVAHIWMPLQRFLRININSASKDFSLRNQHNKMMYDWSSKRKNLLLITGHTHSPVFASGRYFKHPSNKIHEYENEPMLKPSYFNTGCCCFNDGDITGIEISDGHIRLIKWYAEEKLPLKKVLEEISFEALLRDLHES